MCPISVQLSCAGRAGSFVASFHTSIYTFRSFFFHSYRSLGHRVLEQSCIFTHTFYTCTFLLSIMLSIYIHFHFASISIDMGAPDQRALAWHLLLFSFNLLFLDVAVIYIMDWPSMVCLVFKLECISSSSCCVADPRDDDGQWLWITSHTP